MSPFPQVPVPPSSGASGSPPVPWRIIEAFAVFGLSLVLTVAALVVLTVFEEAGLLPADLARALFLPLSGIVLGVTAFAWVRLRHGAASRLLRGRRPWRASDALVGLAVGIGAWLGIVVLVGLLVQQLTGGDVPELQPEFRELATDPAIAPFFVFGAVVVAPIAEELFFRGMLFQALRDRLGLWPGIGISAVAFSTVHLDTGGEALRNLLIFIVIFPLGIVLAWLFQRRGSLLVPITVHAVFNAVQVVLMLLGPA